MTIRELDSKYFETRTTRKKKGAGKGCKVSHTTVWREGVKPCDYLAELSSIDRTACGLLLCKIEFADTTEDRWWDTPDYRATYLKEYRRKITDIRKEYGLRSADVAGFMKVG